MNAALRLVPKLGVSIVLLALLVADVRRADPDALRALRDTSPSWAWLTLGWACQYTTLALGVFRWRAILTVLGVESPIGSLFRYATFAYTVDFAALGTAGGDLTKAILLARERHAERAPLVASVILDRIAGLHALITIVAVVALLGPARDAALRITQHVLILGAVITNGLVVTIWLTPALTDWLSRASAAWGAAGAVLRAIISGIGVVRDRPLALIPILLVNVSVVTLFILGFYFVGVGTPGAAPTFAEQWQIVPLAMLTALLPLPGGHLGALDYAMSFLAVGFSAGRVAPIHGLVVVMLSRLTSLSVAVAGVALYATGAVTVPPDAAQNRD